MFNDHWSYMLYGEWHTNLCFVRICINLYLGLVICEGHEKTGENIKGLY